MEDCTNRRNRELKVYDNTDDLATDLADYIAHLSETSVMERGYFSVALSGEPLIGFLRKLCGVPYTRTVDWTKWYIFWADERVVSRNHVDSNYKLAKDEFLTKVPVLPGRVHSINDSLSAEDAAADYQFVLRQMVKMRAVSVSESDDCPMFDLILLSMGHDGHIASLFPGHPALEQNGEWVTHLTDSPSAPLERITFTLPVINSASNVAVLAVGEANAEAARIATSPACKGIDDASVLPVQLVQPTNGKLVWFLDKAAASKLDASVWNSLE